MIDYTIPLLMGLVFVSLFLSIGYFYFNLKDREDKFAGVLAFICALISGVLFAIVILKTILWIRGL